MLGVDLIPSAFKQRWDLADNQASSARGQMDSVHRQFWGETKPPKHLFRPSKQIRRTFLQVTQVKSVVASTCLELIDFISISMPTPYHVTKGLLLCDT